MDYQQLRTFADSWGLLSMVLFLVGVVGWTFRPGSRKAQDDARMIPFRDDEAEQ
ncbi:cbb3-type cytochrome c oxidase subunit 3 [Sandaracinobacter sp. RS1-74]|uniref:cbb3-type cytochrome oxidase subunit 3 n=1 Tax=Sandaracinobacteroides sayramensis TaxID=2913411 RepID=UPI001EDA2447|nr:cbb3-type cytochrome c oxidase subunit 3 [Sandaracinobacteroides sayramensis]MCG2841449.1 cbb3-type cytochrome c oxidase subunit 3 [Sandaracinobacteroides sayramensis]